MHSYFYQLTLWICTYSLKCWPLSMDRHPAPPPNPYPLGPYLRPWQFLQNSTDSCSLQFVESRALEHMPGEGGKKEELVTKSAEIIPINFWLRLNIGNLLHLKQVLWNLYPPATRSSAAYTDLPHLGHLGVSTGVKGILGSASWECNGFKDPVI